MRQQNYRQNKEVTSSLYINIKTIEILSNCALSLCEYPQAHKHKRNNEVTSCSLKIGQALSHWGLGTALDQQTGNCTGLIEVHFLNPPMLSKYQLCPSSAPCVYLSIESMDWTILPNELLCYGSVFASQEINDSGIF